MQSKFVFVAQLVEQLTLNQRVHGSSPCEDTLINCSVGHSSTNIMVCDLLYTVGHSNTDNLEEQRSIEAEKNTPWTIFRAGIVTDFVL